MKNPLIRSPTTTTTNGISHKGVQNDTRVRLSPPFRMTVVCPRAPQGLYTVKYLRDKKNCSVKNKSPARPKMGRAGDISSFYLKSTVSIVLSRTIFLFRFRSDSPAKRPTIYNRRRSYNFRCIFLRVSPLPNTYSPPTRVPLFRRNRDSAPLRRTFRRALRTFSRKRHTDIVK